MENDQPRYVETSPISSPGSVTHGQLCIGLAIETYGEGSFGILGGRNQNRPGCCELAGNVGLKNQLSRRGSVVDRPAGT